MPKIEMGREYITKSGHEVRIYALDGEGNYSVHGAVNSNGGWHYETWTAEGLYAQDFGYPPFDLIPKLRTVKVDQWINVYPGGVLGGGQKTPEAAAIVGGKNDRIACIHLEMEVQEGEGL